MIFVCFVGYLLYFHLKYPKVYFSAHRDGRNLLFEYDHDFSSNGFLSIKIAYTDKGVKKIIDLDKSIWKQPSKNTVVIKDFNKEINGIKVIYALQYDRLAASYTDGEEVILVKQ